jgi:hypothetical protein
MGRGRQHERVISCDASDREAQLVAVSELPHLSYPFSDVLALPLAELFLTQLVQCPDK